MKIDITKLPVLEGVVAFLLIAMALGFTAAFMATSGDDHGPSGNGNGAPTEPPDGNGNGVPSGDEIAIDMGDNFFDPDEVTVAAGQTVTFQLTNIGGAPHNMQISVDGEYQSGQCDGTANPCSDPNIVLGGGTATLEWTAPDTPGEIPFHCDFHPVEMTGVITVQ